MAKVTAHLKPWHKKTLISFAALLIFLTVLWALLPTITKKLANHYLKPYQAELTAAEINPDVFPIGLSLSEVAITQEGKQTFALKQLSVGLDFWPLFTGAFHVNHILIDGFSMQVTQVPEGWVVAGIPTYSSEAETEQPKDTEEEEKGSVPPTFFIRNASIQDTSVTLTTDSGIDSFAIANLNITEVSHEMSNWRGVFDLEADINNGKAVLDGDIRANQEQVDADIDLANLHLSSSDVAHFLPAGLGSLSTSGLQLEGKTQTTYRFDNNPMLSFSSPLITLNSQDFNLEQDNQTVHWQSMASGFADVSLQMTDSKTMALETSNSLTVEGLNIESGDNRLDLGKLTLSNNLSLGKRGQQLNIEKADTQLTLEQSHAKSGNNSVQLATLETGLTDVIAELSLKDFSGVASTDFNFSAKTLVGQLPQGEDFDLKSLTIKAPLKAQLEPEQRTLEVPTLDVVLSNGQFAGKDLSAQLEALTLAFTNTKIDQSAEALKVGNDSIKLQLKNSAFKNPQLDVASGNFALALNDSSLAQSDKSLRFSGQSKINSENVNVTLNNLADQPLTNLGYNALSLASQITWQQTNEISTLAASNNGLSLSNLGLEQQDSLQSLLKSLQLDSSDIQVRLNDNGLEQLTSRDTQLQLADLSSSLNDGSTLVNWQNFNAKSSNISLDQSGTNAQIDAITINDFLASKPNSDSALPALASFDAMAVSNVQLEPNGLVIDEVNIDKLLSAIALAEDRSLANLVLPKSLQSEPAQTEESTPNNTDSTNTGEKSNAKDVPFYVIVHHAQLSPGSQFTFADKGIKPALSRVLDIEKLSIENLNTRNPDEQMHMILKAKNGDYATIESDVKIVPSANRLTMEAQATVREIELPPVSPYVSSALGYQIQSGQLNMDLNLKSNQGVLDGNSHIVLRQFDLGGQKDSNALLQVGAVPLDLAVDALKNRDNNIVLDLPMKGDIDNPDFQWQNFFMLPIRQGLFKASSTYLMQTFIPYANVITLVQFAGEQALRLRVEPLQFALDEEDITAPEQEEFLDQMIKLMKDRKDSELKACGVSVVRDIDDIITYKQLTEEDQTNLLDLANRRAETLKRYLVDNGIPSSRVFLCSPSIDKDKNALPRVTFTF